MTVKGIAAVAFLRTAREKGLRGEFNFIERFTGILAALSAFSARHTEIVGRQRELHLA